MRNSRAHALVDALETAGISHVFGIPGTHNIELYDALSDSKRISTVLLTDEQSAGFMADGYARASGKLAAICLVPGAGLTHALSGIAEAFMDNVPLLVIACGTRRDLNRKFQLHGIDQLAVVRPVSKWAGTVSAWNQLPNKIAAAARLATQAPAGPVVLEIPGEFLLPSQPQVSGLQEEARIPKPEVPALADELHWGTFRALIGGSRQIGIYVGNIARHPDDSARLVRLAHQLNAWVWSSISAKGLYPEDDDRFLWNVPGLASPGAIRKLESEVDLWIMLGGKFGEVPTASYGFSPGGRVVHVDVSAEAFGKNLREDLSLVCDAWSLIDRLIQENITAGNPDSVNASRRARLEVTQSVSTHSPQVQGKIEPRELFRALQAVMPVDTAYSVDSGNGMFLAMEHLRLTRPRCFLAPVDFSCMGYSVPAAIGARISNPNRMVVALPGDGAFLMTGLELLTGIREGASPLVIVLRDGKLSQIAQFQQRNLGRETVTDLSPYEVKKIAEAIGAHHRELSDRETLEQDLRALMEACQSGIPVLAEVRVNYSEPTHFTLGVVESNLNRMPEHDRARIQERLRERKLKNALSPIEA